MATASGPRTAVLLVTTKRLSSFCCQGNQSNRSVLLNSKVIDYVNFILRASEFQTCSAEKVCVEHCSVYSYSDGSVGNNSVSVALLVQQGLKIVRGKSSLMRLCYAVVMQVLQLKVTIGNLVMTMIEENSVESLVVAKVSQTTFRSICTNYQSM